MTTETLTRPDPDQMFAFEPWSHLIGTVVRVERTEQQGVASVKTVHHGELARGTDFYRDGKITRTLLGFADERHSLIIEWDDVTDVRIKPAPVGPVVEAQDVIRRWAHDGLEANVAMLEVHRILGRGRGW